MSSKAIKEFDAKQIVHKHLQPSSTGASPHYTLASPRMASLVIASPHESERVFLEAEKQNPWLVGTPLVVKPDQLVKRRGKASMLLLKASWEQVKDWVRERAGKEHDIGQVRGVLTSFIVEPFVEHTSEVYVCLQATRDGDELLFCPQGGVDIGNVDEKAQRVLIRTGTRADPQELLRVFPEPLNHFMADLHALAVKAHFTLVEVNPLVITAESVIHVLDMAAKLDQAADFEAGKYWTLLDNAPFSGFPAPFGRVMLPEEAYVASLDSKTGASLKLTILNPLGKIWTMVAGGGASVAYADAIASLGFADELANYGEYSGAPSETHTYEYAKVILDLMTRPAAGSSSSNNSNNSNNNASSGSGAAPSTSIDGKILFIGGGIANFTNVASTFKGIIRALQEFAPRLVAANVSVWVRRGGPNWQEGLKSIRDAGDTLGLSMHVFGPETHITAIVPMALVPASPQSVLVTPPLKALDSASNLLEQLTLQGVGARTPSPGPNFGASPSKPSGASSGGEQASTGRGQKLRGSIRDADNALMQVPRALPTNEGGASFPPSSSSVPPPGTSPNQLFSQSTRSFVYGMQPKAIQGMLDFDYISRRGAPSVAAMIYPFGGEHVQKFYWGTQEVLLPVYASLKEAMERHRDVDTLVNFASCRSAKESSIEAIEAGMRTVAIIAEGIPERHTKELIEHANRKNEKHSSNQASPPPCQGHVDWAGDGGRAPGGCFSYRQHWGDDRQCPGGPSLPPRPRLLRQSLRGNVQRAQQHHLAVHGRGVRGGGDRGGPVPGELVPGAPPPLRAGPTMPAGRPPRRGRRGGRVPGGGGDRRRAPHQAHPGLVHRDVRADARGP